MRGSPQNRGVTPLRSSAATRRRRSFRRASGRASVDFDKSALFQFLNEFFHVSGRHCLVDSVFRGDINGEFSTGDIAFETVPDVQPRFVYPERLGATHEKHLRSHRDDGDIIRPAKSLIHQCAVSSGLSTVVEASPAPKTPGWRIVTPDCRKAPWQSPPARASASDIHSYCTTFLVIRSFTPSGCWKIHRVFTRDNIPVVHACLLVPHSTIEPACRRLNEQSSWHRLTRIMPTRSIYQYETVRYAPRVSCAVTNLG